MDLIDEVGPRTKLLKKKINNAKMGNELENPVKQSPKSKCKPLSKDKNPEKKERSDLEEKGRQLRPTQMTSHEHLT